MKIFYFLLILFISQYNISASYVQRINQERLAQYSEQYSEKNQKKSRLKRKKRRIDRKVQYLRDKIDDEEADSSEPAKFYDALQEQKELDKKIEALSRS